MAQLEGSELGGSGLVVGELSPGERIGSFTAPVTAEGEAQGLEMMSTTGPISDAELLQRYDSGNNEAAFAALVERYQTMVLGAALRKTGNVELAREIAQEVFAALARKARFLNTRASLGGWLHQATIYQAARTLQSEVRRHARHERFAEVAPRVSLPAAGNGSGSDHLAIIDEALGHLSTADREVIVLHYFQDLSYPEMAKVLRVNEPAVRQRVSRALERLGKRLREQGVTGNAVVLLLSCVAVQTTVAAPAGLAGAALATAAAGGGYSAYLLLTAILSQGAVKTAAVLLALASVAALWHELPVLQRLHQGNVEIPEMQRSDALHASMTPAAAETRSGAGNDQSGGGQSLVRIPPLQGQAPGGSGGQLAGQGASLPVATSGAPQTVMPAGQAVPSLTSPPRIADSKATPAGKDSPQTSRTPNPRAQDITSSPADSGSPSDPLPSSPDFHFPGVLGEIAEVGGLQAVIDELRRAELVPHEAAKLYGELLEDVLSLDPVKRTLVEGFLEDHYEQLNEQGVAGIKPSQIAEESLRTLRDASATEVVDGVQEILSDVAPDPKVIDDVFALVEQPDSGADNPQLTDPLKEVSDVGIISALPKITAPLKLPLVP